MQVKNQKNTSSSAKIISEINFQDREEGFFFISAQLTEMPSVLMIRAAVILICVH